MRSRLGLVILLLSAVCAQAQTLSGQWQGTLHQGGRDYRMVLKIVSANGRTSATAYSIDEEPVSMPMSLVQKGSAVTFAIDQKAENPPRRVDPLCDALGDLRKDFISVTRQTTPDPVFREILLKPQGRRRG